MGKIIVNDALQELSALLGLLELIALNRVLQPDMVSVQLNGEFVAREDFASTQIVDGDVVDFLYFMGGGAYGLD
ncbi:MAG: sulfur carrier protein ThiS [Rikenellaceae bacterium]|jgi:sulfur carrier protein|nr:sulfur carrier protein ThiS [Rikenellaceae bacterium]